MKKRLTALLLCLVMLGVCMGVSLLLPPDIQLIDEASGEAVTQVAVSENGRVALTTDYESENELGYQWQISSDGKTWFNISGQTDYSVNLSYGMVCNMLSEDEGTAQVRCLVTEGDEVYESDAAQVRIDYSPAVQPMTGAAMPVADAQPAAQSEESGVMPLSDDGSENVKATYNLVINYAFENNSLAADPYTANLAEGEAFSQTVTFPTVQGYLPYVNDVQQDSHTFTIESVSENVTINVVYKPTNVNYRVIHYQQNVDDDDNTPVETETKQGLTASVVPEVAKTYEGFYALLYERPAIAADGSTVIEIYYDRYYYLMNFDMDGGYGTEPVYARYGAAISAETPTKAGYIFGGWSETKPTGNTDETVTTVPLPETMPAENRTYYAYWLPESSVRVTFVFWGENADDENYSYLSSNSLLVNPQDNFMYTEDGALICAEEEHTHSDACGYNCGQTAHTHSAVGGSCYTLNCQHTHTTDCYKAEGTIGNDRGLEEIKKPTQTLTDKGNGIYTYTKNGSTYYCVNIGDKWYQSNGWAGLGSSGETEIKCNCSHKHANSCYTLTCVMAEHTHSASCGYACGKTEHKHGADCYMNKDMAGLDSNLWKFVKSDKVNIEQDGSTVVNVYYDRTEFTLKFIDDDNSTKKTITQKWGADIHSEFPIKEGDKTIWWSVPSGCTSMKPGTQFGSLDTMPAENISFTYYSATNAATLHYYVEALDGQDGKTPQQIYSGFTSSNYSGIDNTKKFTLYKDINVRKSSGVYLTYTEEFHDIIGFRQYVSNPKFDKHELGGKTSGVNTDNYLLYLRNAYNIVFYNPTELIKTQEDVPYQAPLKDYNWEPTSDMAPDKYEPGSVKFDGWYLNPECTGEKFDFDTATMPSDATNTNGAVALSLYAKWVPVTHTVTFYLDSDAYKAGTTLESHPAKTVTHGDIVGEVADPEKGDYTFIGWFYMDNGVEKAFDFANMEVRKDLHVYAKWSSNTLKEYTVQFVLKDDHSVKVADDITSSGLAGTTKTFDAKGGTELYADYNEGYFPTAQSQSILLDIEAESLVLTFEYVEVEAEPYTVKYVAKDTGESLADDKVVSDNKKAVVTETFKSISGYMPDAYQKRLVVTADGDNVLYFYYSKDETHAYYKITHYTQNTDGATWTEYASSQVVGDINKRYTASPMTIPGYTYDNIEYEVNGVKVTDITADGAVLTADGLEINLYYVRNNYPYQVRYLEQGSGKVLANPKNGTGLYGQVISESAIAIDNYTAVDPTSATLNIRIDDGEGAPNLNIITFYYKENEVTVNYKVVGPDGCGTVSPASETLKVLSGTAQGSTAAPADNAFKFVGWYSDADCTNELSTDAKFVPEKVDGKNAAATYYAKFDYKLTSMTLTKDCTEPYDANDMFIFTVKDSSGNEFAKVALKAGESVTIDGLTVGETYTVAEDNDWSWRYKDQTTQTIKISADKNANVVTVTNEVANTNWLSASSYAINKCVKSAEEEILEIVKNIFGA